jgi:hypothetical protein
MTPAPPPTEGGGDLEGRRTPRRQSQSEPTPKVYSEEDFNRRLAEVRRVDQQNATTAELRKSQSELESRISQIGIDVQTSIKSLKGEILKQQEEISKSAEEARLWTVERTEQFRLADLGEFEMGKFPDLLRWWARNEPILSVLVARSMAESVVREKGKEELERRHYTVVTVATLLAVGGTFIGILEWVLTHIH